MYATEQNLSPAGSIRSLVYGGSLGSLLAAYLAEDCETPAPRQMKKQPTHPPASKIRVKVKEGCPPDFHQNGARQEPSPDPTASHIRPTTRHPGVAAIKKAVHRSAHKDSASRRTRHAARVREVIIIGGGLAGLSAGIYLGRALRDTLIIDGGRSLAVWEPEVQNYLGFPKGISGEALLDRGLTQAERYGVSVVRDEILTARFKRGVFVLRGRQKEYTSKRLLLATGLYHIPPDIPGVQECLGHSMFFCKDCDGYRVEGKRIVIFGSNNEAVRYALGLLLYSSCVMITTNGKKVVWDRTYSTWLQEYEIPIYEQPVTEVIHKRRQVQSLLLEDGTRIEADAIFTTRGDIYHNTIAKALGAKLDADGQVMANNDGRTSVAGLYAAGCVTPANCQMIIAAGDGATAAQAINCDLLDESLAKHSLRLYRDVQRRHFPTTSARSAKSASVSQA
jgi:thioredoxin reductase (NADPH)